MGSFPGGESPYGVHDMAGNVREWVADWYDVNYYRKSPEHNPTGPLRGGFKVFRGGSWVVSPEAARVTRRLSASPDYWHYDVGFRCTKDAPAR